MRPLQLSVVLSLAFCGRGEIIDRPLLSYTPTPENIYQPPKSSNIITLADFIRSRPDLSTLAKVLEEPQGFAAAFQTVPNWDFTFFAPSDQAFNNTGQYFETYASTLKGKWWLGDLLQHHYIPNTKLPSSIFNETQTRIQTGTFLYISTQVKDGTVILNGVARVTESNLAVERGVVHIIDHVLDPSAQVYMPDLPGTSQRFIAGSCSNPNLPYC